MLGNIGNLLSDLDFWGGVATGASQQIDIQEERKDRDYRELRKFGMERSLQISDDNTKLLDDAEKQVKELASMISGNRSATSPEAMEAAFYLIERECGVACASQIAKRYQQQYDNFGISPITEMGLEPRGDTSTISPASIARQFTKLKPLPDISQSALGSHKTALDVIFGGDSVEDIVGEEMRSMFGTPDKDTPSLIPVSADPTDEEFIIGSNFSVEKGRLMALHDTHRKVPKQNQDAEWKAVDNLLNARISLLEEATKDLMPETSRKSVKNALLAEITSSFGLKADFYTDGSYKDAGMHQDIYKKVNTAISRMTTILMRAKNKRYKGVHPVTGEVYDPREFIEVFGAGQGYNIIEVFPDDGDPYITFMEDDFIFSKEDMKSPEWESSAWKSSITLDQNDNSGQQGAAASPVTGSATGQGSSVIPDSLLINVKSQVPSTRKAAANAIMTRLKSANTGMNQVQLEALFDITTGISWNVASK